MTPNEKAEELINKFLKLTSKHKELETAGLGAITLAKQCALFAVDEIIKLNVFDCNDEWSDEDGDTREYWQQVKQEIEKL